MPVIEASARLLRGILDFGTDLPTSETRAANYERLKASRLDWVREDDSRIVRFIEEFFLEHLEIPSAITIHEHFEERNDHEVVERMKVVGRSRVYDRAGYTHFLQRTVEERNNIVITGLTGVGKTYLACAFAQQACRRGHRTLYRRVPRLLDEITLARADGTWPRLLRLYSKTEVLVLDDFGLAPLTAAKRHELLEVFEEREDRGSTIITSQLPQKKWHEYLGDPTVADGFRIASKHLGSILGYALISATVGMILRWISERGKGLGQIASSILGLAWNLATYLVVPVLVIEGVGPWEAVKRSAGLLKKTWGEQIVGNFSIGAIFGLISVLAILISIPVAFVLVTAELYALLIPLVVLLVVFFTLMGLISSTLNGIYVAAVYRYAADGEAGGFFNEEMVRGAFRDKSSSRRTPRLTF